MKDVLCAMIMGALFAYLMVWGMCSSWAAEDCAAKGLAYSHTSIMLVGHCDE